MFLRLSLKSSLPELLRIRASRAMMANGFSFSFHDRLIESINALLFLVDILLPRVLWPGYPWSTTWSSLPPGRFPKPSPSYL
jgi:hypothetical protein